VSILRRNAHDRFSTVEREWEGDTVVLIGGGPSLTLEQVALVKSEHEAGRVRCIAVNDAYLWAPWADVNYFADASWWKMHTVGTPKPMLKLSAEQVRERFAAFAGMKCSIQSQAANIMDDAVHILRNKSYPKHSDGLSLDPTMLVTGRHGGYQSLNLAVLAGAKTIILIGYDAKAKDGRTHWSGGHAGSHSGEAEWLAYRKSFSEGQNAIRAAGVRVINASPGSSIDTFQKMTLEDALARCLETA
jgi:hypothetical protein